MSEKIYDMVTLETIEKLADLVAAKDLGEITIASEDKCITIKGKKCPPPMPPMGVPMAAPAPAAEEKPLSGKIIKSPIVGTFYASPSPDQPPFVQVGDTVKKGDVIMIIESMKLMNEVQSDMDGTVQEILVKNGEAVEYDQPLMILA